MAAAVHLVHICSSYISNTSVAGRLMLRDLIFFSSPLCHFLHPYLPFLWRPFSMTIHTSVEIALNFDFSLNVLLSSCLCLDVTCLWFPSTRRFSGTKCFHSCRCMQLHWLCVSKWRSALLKPLKKTISLPVITFLSYFLQSELKNLHLMQAATCWIGGRHFSFQSKALQNRCYHLPPLFFATWNCTYGKPTRSWDSPSNLSTIWSPPPARPHPISLRGCLRSWSNFSFNGTSG